MIRLREQNFPPVYQLELSLLLLRSGLNDEALSVLKAEPLYDVRSVEVAYVNKVNTMYSDGRFADPFTPILVPNGVEMSVKVAYTDALEEYQTANDKLWSSEDWGIYRYHVLDWFRDDPYSHMDCGSDDMRYHKFMYVRDMKIYTIEEDTKQGHSATVVWYDFESQKTYCTNAQMLLNSGTKSK